MRLHAIRVYLRRPPHVSWIRFADEPLVDDRRALTILGDHPHHVMPSEFEPQQWVCPMHPEVVRDAPGSCPICGMGLEPKTVTLENGRSNPELRDMTRRFWVSVAFAVPLLVVSMGDMLPGHPISALIGERARVWVELALATPVCLWSAWPFYVRFFASLRNMHLNMWTLIGIGVGVSYTFSVVAAVAPDVFPASFRDH